MCGPMIETEVDKLVKRVTEKERERAEKERHIAEQERDRAEKERHIAEQERNRAEKAEDALSAKNAEIAALKAQIAEMQKKVEHSRRNIIL